MILSKPVFRLLFAGILLSATVNFLIAQTDTTVFLKTTKVEVQEYVFQVPEKWKDVPFVNAATKDKKFDFIYIDGDHVPHQVMLDALLSWKILKVGGVMGFDDYGWSIDDPMAPESYKWDSHAGPAIDLFLRMYSKNIEQS